MDPPGHLPPIHPAWQPLAKSDRRNPHRHPLNGGYTAPRTFVIQGGGHGIFVHGHGGKYFVCVFAAFRTGMTMAVEGAAKTMTAEGAKGNGNGQMQVPPGTVIASIGF
jgi:hypothetical protein